MLSLSKRRVIFVCWHWYFSCVFFRESIRYARRLFSNRIRLYDRVNEYDKHINIIHISETRRYRYSIYIYNYKMRSSIDFYLAVDGFRGSSVANLFRLFLTDVFGWMCDSVYYGCCFRFILVALIFSIYKKYCSICLSVWLHNIYSPRCSSCVFSCVNLADVYFVFTHFHIRVYRCSYDSFVLFNIDNSFVWVCVCVFAFSARLCWWEYIQNIFAKESSGWIHVFVFVLIMIMIVIGFAFCT